jgi:hypothetical protein
MMRFKTQAEMQSEFGDKWKSKCYWNSGGEMDYLFNTKISDKLKIPYIGFDTNTICKYDGWHVHKNAVKLEDINPNITIL